ncbi:cell division cycle protein 123 homolog [Hydra vulgaris]|uniref:Cell division cycle protein 123 homolog n=1 Tax=Hydra vulgaris TaxID=6087 RepID=A0ABM4CIY6_HYDVU
MSLSRQQCINCIFSNWYNSFKDITFRSKVVRLSPDFIAYLKKDGVVLPSIEETRYVNDLDGYSDSDNEDWDTNDQDRTLAPCFSLIKNKVDKVIDYFGGSVFPKLNWSSPKDAVWITMDGTMKCSSFNDICLLLKSSDFISHDLNDAYSHCIESTLPHSDDAFELVLREWVDLIPSMEFRVFVKERTIVGISQRHSSGYYGYLHTQKDILLQEIIRFFNLKIKSKFLDSNFVFDIVKLENGCYKLLDFNPFGEVTDGLLFSWSELLSLSPQSIDNSKILRLVSELENIQPNPYLSYRLPKDVVDLSCGEDVSKMIDFFNVHNLVAKPGKSKELSDDEEVGEKSKV